MNDSDTKACSAWSWWFSVSGSNGRGDVGSLLGIGDRAMSRKSDATWRWGVQGTSGMSASESWLGWSESSGTCILALEANEPSGCSSESLFLLCFARMCFVRPACVRNSREQPRTGHENHSFGSGWKIVERRGMFQVESKSFKLRLRKID